jgi:hypothetical protein
VNLQVVGTLDGELACISDPIDGARHDVFCVDESGALDTLDPSDWTSDKGYVGRGIITPFKKTSGEEILDWQKEFNTAVNELRAVIERLIANFKNWRVLHTETTGVRSTPSVRRSPPSSDCTFTRWRKPRE